MPDLISRDWYVHGAVRYTAQPLVQPSYTKPTNTHQPLHDSLNHLMFNLMLCLVPACTSVARYHADMHHHGVHALASVLVAPSMNQPAGLGVGCTTAANQLLCVGLEVSGWHMGRISSGVLAGSGVLVMATVLASTEAVLHLRGQHAQSPHCFSAAIMFSTRFTHAPIQLFWHGQRR